ncbi:hypothetical protein ACIA8E_16415 [Streptomyces sp. NPDC051664]|uniref:hypothetical protein n=1 Tax=Streptomyces sp. NPDC051664 TaxID=3365668 RepID=UPI00379E7223
MALDEARQGTHGGGCTCGDCPHGAREGHRRAVAAFLAKRDELAAGQGLPTGVAQSASATRQWVSDELTESARTVAERNREAGDAWLHQVWVRTLTVVWGGVALLAIGEAGTAIGAGWSTARTAGLVAALVTAGLLTGAARFHRARGGVLAPLIGEDNRLSTSRAVAVAWVLLAVFSVLVLALQLAGASGHAERDALIDGLELARGAGVLTALALVCAIAVVVRRVVTVRALAGRLQKLRADRPRAADLLTDDSGRGSFTDVQYVLVSAVSVLFAVVRLARRPEQLPDLPWGLALLVAVSAATYFAGKYTEGGRPVVLSVVRAREPGDLDAPIRTGDDIEIRGAGFVPPGAGAPDRLARVVVRIGRVHVHVPLVPVAGGFANPADTVLTVPVPVEVEPGLVDVQVVTAAGVETNRVEIDVTD